MLGYVFDSFVGIQGTDMFARQVLCCTWGEHGAVAAIKYVDGRRERAEVPAWKPTADSHPKVVDTIGAGDTFIAGMIFALSHHEDDWTLEQKLKLANELAGRKVLQYGFSDLMGSSR